MLPSYCCNLLRVLLFWVFSFSRTLGNYSEDQCDWNRSGENEDPSLRMVQQVYLRCTRGHVQWRYPVSAIRISFYFLDKNTDFRLCIRPAPNSLGANVYRDIPYGDIIPLILERRADLEYLGRGVPHRALKEKVDAMLHRTRPQETQCFDSREGKAVLLLEAQENPLHLHLVTSFDYVLEPLTENRLELYHNYNDCRQCNATELVREFCAADFVIKSRLLDISPDVATSQNYIEVLASHIYRQSNSVFLPARHNHYRGVVTRPLQCPLVKDHGSYLITGGISLGEAKAGCLVRFHQAQRWFRDMTERGLNECDLSGVTDYPR